MKKTLFRRIGTAVLVVGSILYTVRTSRRQNPSGSETGPAEDYGDLQPEYRDTFDRNPIVPAGWTFAAVWSTIYTGTVAYAVHQALPSEADNLRYRRAAPWLASAYVLNALFGRFFQDTRMESMIAADLITKASLPVALQLHQELEIGRTEVPAPEKYLRIPLSLYAGWLTAASVVGTPNLLLNLKLWKPDPVRDTPIFMGVLGATGGAAYAVARRLNDPYFLLPFVAGFAGIATRQYRKNDAIAYTAGILAVATAAVAARWIPEGRFRPLPAEVTDIEYDEEEEQPWWENEGRNEDWETYSYTSI